MTWRHSRQPLRDILAISRRGVRLFDLQWRFAPVYALGEFFIFLGVGAVLTCAPAAARRSRRRLQMLLLLGTSLPLALFFLGPLDPGGVVRPYVILAALACALTWLSWRASAPVASLGAMLTVTAGLVALDAMTGGHLLGSFMMNFGVMYGSRFYGIGNETMGFVVACAAIGAAALLQESGTTKRRMWALALWFVAIAVVIGAPFWGANWGGTITAAFAFAVAFAGIRAGRPRLRHWAVALIAAVAAGALAVALDLLGDARTWSHIGGSAGLVSAGGLPAAFDIVTRKALGNLRIMTIVPGLWMTLVVWAAGAFLVFKPPARLRAALAANSAVWAGLAGGIAAALIAILVNDSGIVAASSVMGVTASSIAYTAVTGSEASP